MYIIIEFNAEERDFGKELSQTGRLEGQVLVRASLNGTKPSFNHTKSHLAHSLKDGCRLRSRTLDLPPG